MTEEKPKGEWGNVGGWLAREGTMKRERERDRGEKSKRERKGEREYARGREDGLTGVRASALRRKRRTDLPEDGHGAGGDGEV